MKHDRNFDPNYGSSVELAPGVRRLTAQNPSPFTFHGTNTYLLGQKSLVVVDPGPVLSDHLNAIMAASAGSTIEAILVTHTHVDHSPGAKALQKASGAPIVGCGPHVSSRPLMEGEVNPLDASGDRDYSPDQHLKHGEIFEAAGLSLEVVATPGHTANHLSFAIRDENLLLSADHVMAWSTSIVAAPDGNMRDYMASLETLVTRPEDTYLPGHGGIVHDAKDYVQALKDHRQGREQSILRELSSGPKRISEIVEVLYADVDRTLHTAAGLSVFAHLEDLCERGFVSSHPGMSLTSKFELTAWRQGQIDRSKQAI